MDKLKTQLAPVAKHWFWIATGLVLIGSFAIWWMASGKLITEYQAASSKIETNATAVSGVQGKLSEHPNPKTHAEMLKLIEARKQAVLAAWSSIYKRQQEILVWPVAELNEDFVREFRDLTPIEEKVPFPTPDDQEKETTLLNRYRYYIENVLPGIAEIAKTKWTAKFDQVSGGMETSGYAPGPSSGEYPGIGAPVEGPLVKWEAASQEALLTDLFPWRTVGQPKTLDVLYSQENLWILRQLMEIIANVNGDAGQRFQAKIHDINRISIGRSVSTTAGKISKPSTGINMMMGGGDMSGMDSGSGMESMGSPGSDSSSAGMGGMDLVAIDPGDNRYVDTAGKPVLASQLRAALASNSPTDAFMAVAKRIPVMMSFKMDQRAIPDLIAKCGSARLMVEVGQVRILPSGTSAASSMGGGYESGGQGSSMMASSGDSGGMSGSSMGSSSMSSPGGPVTEQFPLDLDVEIYGIIYIYNPPLENSLGIEAVTEDTVVEGTAMIDGSKVAPAPSEAAAVPVVAAPPESLPAPTAPAATAPAATAPAAAAPAAETPPAEEPLPPPGVVVPPSAGAIWIPRESSFQQFASIV